MKQTEQGVTLRQVTNIDVWDIEELESDIELVNAYIDLLMDTYAERAAFVMLTNPCEASDAKALNLQLGLCSKLIQGIYERITSIINYAYGHD